MKRFSLFALVAILFAACENITTEEVSNSNLITVDTSDTLYAEFDDAKARTYIEEGNRLCWTKGDEISYFPATTDNTLYRFQGETGDKSGAFAKVTTDPVTGNELDNCYAVYPYVESTTMADDGAISFEIPSTQLYAENSFGLGANVMVAVTESKDDDVLRFKNAGGYLKLQLCGEATVVKSVELKGNGAEKLAGAATITATYGAEPTMVMADDATTTLTLDCGEGVALSKDAKSPTTFWFTLPATTFEKGITVTITDAEGKVFEKSTSKSVAIKRNTIQPMATLEVVCVKRPPKNEIWYTATEKVEPYKTDAFGVNIVSNTFENGQGVITFDGCVTKIGSFAFKNCRSLTSITIPDSVTSIGLDAFYNCSSLTSVAIPDSVTSIESAFWCCSSLTSVIIPDSVTSLGSYSFFGCSSLASVTIGNSVASIKANTFTGCSSLSSVTIPNSVTAIEDEAFVECSNLTAFYGKFASADNRCLVFDGRLTSFAPAGLTEYTIPDGVTSIGVEAFNECSSLTSVIIPNSVTEIGNYAFQNCSSLKSVTIGNGVTSIGRMVFAYCRSLVSVTVPDSVTSIGNGAFDSCRSLVSVTIGNGVTEIGDHAFNNCSSLTAFYGKFASTDNRCLVVDGRLTSFAPVGLTEYTIPDSVTSIGNSAFSYCSSLKSITIPDSVTSIGNSAFWGCKILTSITIPNGVTSIGNDAFRHCSSLTRVYSKPTTPPAGGTNMLANTTSDPKIYVPSQSIDAYKTADGWKAYADSIIPYDFENEVPAFINNKIWYTSSDSRIVEPYKTDAFGANIVSNTYENGQGVITFDGDVTMIGTSAFENCSSLKSVTIPDSVISIGNHAFRGCFSLTSVTIPDSVTAIGICAFRNCQSLTSVTIPDSVTSIGDGVFLSCHSLTEFRGKFAEDNGRILVADGTLIAFAPSCGATEYTIPDSVITIELSAFRDCQSLTSVTIPGSVTTIKGYAFCACGSLKSVTIPNSVTSIGEYVFKGCSSLKSVTIPDSVTSIGTQAFHGCSSLTSITIPGSITEIGEAAFKNCSSLISVYCKPITPPTLGSDALAGTQASGWWFYLYVPVESLNTYINTSGWKEYANWIVGYKF